MSYIVARIFHHRAYSIINRLLWVSEDAAAAFQHHDNIIQVHDTGLRNYACIGYNITRQITPDMGIPSASDLHEICTDVYHLYVIYTIRTKTRVSMDNDDDDAMTAVCCLAPVIAFPSV